MNPLTAGLAVVVVVHGRPDGSARKPACLGRPPSFAHETDGPALPTPRSAVRARYVRVLVFCNSVPRPGGCRPPRPLCVWAR